MTSGQGNATKKMLDPAVLLHAAETTAQMAHRHGVRAALVGGLAMQCYGSPRLTGDLDVALEQALPGTSKAKRLTFGGVRITVDGVPTDLIVRDDKWKKLYAAAIRASVAQDDLPIRIVKPEYLVAMKMVAGRTKDDLDIEYLVISKSISTSAVHLVVEKYLGAFAVDEYDRFADVAKWKHSKGLI